MYAQRFNWTPQQVDELPLDVEPWLVPIVSAMEAEQVRRSEAAQKAAEKKRK